MFDVFCVINQVTMHKIVSVRNPQRRHSLTIAMLKKGIADKTLVLNSHQNLWFTFSVFDKFTFSVFDKVYI